MMEFNGHAVTSDELTTLALYNYGHFTSMRVEDGLRVRGLSLHLERLRHDGRALFDSEPDVDKIRHLVRRLAESVELPTIVRVTLFDPGLDLGYPGQAIEPSILVSTRPAVNHRPPPLRLHAIHYERDLPDVKHTGLFGAIYHRRCVQLSGFDDVLFMNAESNITEGATWNVGFFDGTQVVWPQAAMLSGVTMRLLQAALDDAGVPSTCAAVNILQVSEMRSAFITNVAAGSRPIRSIDDTKLDDKAPFLGTLQETYVTVLGDEL